jgi:flagellar FliL protein
MTPVGRLDASESERRTALRPSRNPDRAMAAKRKGDSAEAADEAEGAAPAKKKLPLKLIIIAAAALIVLGGGGTGAYVLFAGKKEEKPAGPVIKPVAFMDIPDVVVNLAGTGNERTQYLRVRVVLEVPEQSVIAQIQPVLPRIMDAFQTYLRELRPADLEGSAGLYRLKEELTRRVNAAIEPVRINAVLFKELVVQ